MDERVMSKQDIRYWLIRNKRIVSYKVLEERAGLGNGYINRYVIGERVYPFDNDAFFDKIRKVIMEIRAF